MSIKIAKNIKDDFPWFKYNPKWVYLDNSATTLKPTCVIKKVTEYYERYSANPHNSDSSFTYKLSQMINDTRTKLAKLINANFNEVIFTSGATESLNLIANGLQPFVKKNEEIIVTNGEHSSNYLPWVNLANTNEAKVRIVGKKKQIPTGNDIIQSVNQKTKIVAFASTSNLLSYELEVTKIIKEIRKINKEVIIVIDATQTMPHSIVDVKKMDCDFLVASAHKMCASTGVGLLFIKKKWLDIIKPLRFGGGMNNIVDENHFTYAKSPARFEGGTPNVAGILSWGVAIEYLNTIGWKNIERKEHELKEYIIKRIKEIPHIQLVNPYTKYPIIAFNLEGFHSQDIAHYLGKKKIIVRSGLSCAKLANNIIDNVGVVRASFYFYNDKKDADTLISALKQFKKTDILSDLV